MFATPCIMLIIVLLSFIVIALKPALMTTQSQRNAAVPSIYYSNEPIYDMRDADKSPVVFFVQNDLPPPYAKGRFYWLFKINLS